MALFTDGAISGIEDLAAHDSQLLLVSNIEGIDISQKIALAQEALGMELREMLSRLRFADQTVWSMGMPDLGNVAVTPGLKLWHTYRALEKVYGDAYYNQSNDRYAAKRDQFHQLAGRAQEHLIQTGVGMVGSPVPKAASPEVTAVAGGLPDGTYYVTTSWTNDAGEEGASSTPVVITLAASTLSVRAAAPPGTAAGWNIYAGGAPDAMAQQNSAPLEIGSSWEAGTELLATGRAPGAGQEPAYFQPAPRVIQRG